MSERKKTTCVLCGNLCGLEAVVDDNRIVKMLPDKDNPRSEGYLCRKGRNAHYHQHHADRLLHPLKKVGGRFERIPWEQALDEIAERLRGILDAHGPRSLALMGTGTLACPAQAVFAASFLRGLGSRYIYNAIAQELTGRYWADGRTYGRQSLHTSPDLGETDMLLVVGWNPMESHHTPQAPRVLKKLRKDPDRLLVVVDPRRSDTAKIADIHLPIRPGTDALLYRAMISIILNEGWHDQEYIDRHVSGFEVIQPYFSSFDAKAALEVCELDFEQVREICRLFATRRSSHHSDLGVLMNRHSTLVSYLETVLLAICGRTGVPGGNIFPAGLVGRGAHSDERQAGTWRTTATDYPPIMGLFPPNVMPEEITTEGSDRLRAVIVSASNPLRSFADTTAYEEAFGQLDLLVTSDVAMTETGALSHYVLPCLTGYESWDGGFGGGYPKVFMQLRRPVVEAEGEQLESGEVFTRLADRMGLIPELPDALYEAAESGDRGRYRKAFMDFLSSNPEAGHRVPFILSKTLGRKLGSGNLASLWGFLQNLSPGAQQNAARAGFEPGPELGDELFQALQEHPEGLWVGEVDVSDNLAALATEDQRIHLDVPEMLEWIEEIEPALEAERLKPDPSHPFILSAGRHMGLNANTQLRDPAWYEGRRACTLIMHPQDAKSLGISDGQMVRVETEAGEETIELEVTEATRPGYIMIPHGFGLVHEGKQYGVNANRLTAKTHRDRIAATPYHRYIPCNVTPA